jgi:hypothetical protein
VTTVKGERVRANLFYGTGIARVCTYAKGPIRRQRKVIKYIQRKCGIVHLSKNFQVLRVAKILHPSRVTGSRQINWRLMPSV